MIVGIFGVLAYFVSKMSQGGEEESRAEPRDAKAAAKRRGALDRMQRGAGARAAAEAGEVAGEVAEDDDDEGPEGRADRRNAKKDVKKQEKKAAQQADREARQVRDVVKNERQSQYRQRQLEKELERQQREEEEEKARKEKEQQEQEEFAKWKDMFAVEAEGEDDTELRDESAVERFIQHIKLRKVVSLEELASEFRLRTTAAVDRLQQLEKLGRLSGIFDDRGKFVYITLEEMQEVANWLQAKGRISRAELVAACNKIVRLNPTEEDQVKLKEDARAVAEAAEACAKAKALQAKLEEDARAVAETAEVCSKAEASQAAE